jgi:hypothetical protein
MIGANEWVDFGDVEFWFVLLWRKNHEQIFWNNSKVCEKLATTISFSPISMGFMLSLK